MLSDEQLLRYSRQIMLPEVDIEGQQRWVDSKVLILGLGGLGSPVALYLAAAGVGELVLVDDDQVDLSNLQRQVIHTTERIGVDKVESARQSLLAVNPDVKVTAINRRLDEAELKLQIEHVNLVVDCCDNFSTRFAVNRSCFETKTPLVSGAAIRIEGQVAVYDPNHSESPCYQCLYKDCDDENLTCSESGVLAPLVGIIGSVQAMEALKVLASVGQPLVGQLLLLDGRSMDWRKLKLRKDPACPVCSTG